MGTEHGKWYWEDDDGTPHFNKGRVMTLLVALTACVLAAILLTDIIQTAYNNTVTQPLTRSRLDSDANYRRAVESQAHADIALYDRSAAQFPTDEHTLNVWLHANPGPAWDLMQQQQYGNLEAQVQGDINSHAYAATDYNNLVTNPDNQGLFTFDPALPSRLDVTPLVEVTGTP